MGSTAIAMSGSRAPVVTSASLPISTRTLRLIAYNTIITPAEAASAICVPVNVANPPHKALPSARLACTVTRFIPSARARTQGGAVLCVAADRLANT